MYFLSFWKILPIVSLFFDFFILFIFLSFWQKITKLKVAQKSSKINKMSNEGNVYIMYTYLLTCVRNLNIILQTVFELRSAQTICPDNGSSLILQLLTFSSYFHMFVKYKIMCASHVQNSQLFHLILFKTLLSMWKYVKQCKTCIKYLPKLQQ